MIYQYFFVFLLWRSNNTDNYTIKTFYTSEVLCLSLASQLPSHLIIPPWSPCEVKLRLQAGNWAVSSLWTGTENHRAPWTQHHLPGCSYSGHWVNLDILLKPRQKKEIVDKMTFPCRGSKFYYCIIYGRCCYAWNKTQPWDSTAEAEMVCVSFCLRQPAWLGATHPGRSCWRGKQGF